MEWLAFSSQPRGLVNFISDIRDAKSKEDERTRIDKELGNIRLKFSSSSTLSSYQKKKYVWKMCYIYMLGYDVDFGHSEFISIIGSQKYQEKAVGYMAIALMIKPGDELLTLVINSIRNDLNSGVHTSQCLALAVVANLAASELCILASDVERLIIDINATRFGYAPFSVEQEHSNRCFVRKKAALCLLSLFRQNQDCLDLHAWAGHLTNILDEKDAGVLTSATSLALHFATVNPDLFGCLVRPVVSILNRLVLERSLSTDYLYYRISSPWLQVKCLRFLQLYNIPEDRNQQKILTDCLNEMMSKDPASAEHTNLFNTINSILMDAVDLVINYGPDLVGMHELAVSWLGKFIQMEDPNARYLGLDAMIRFAKQHGAMEIREHQNSVIASLKDTDISIQKRALELLYVMADDSNAEISVSELCGMLETANSTIKEEMVVKIALIAEAHSKAGAEKLRWYIDTIISVVLKAGDFVSENVWHRVIQIITNNPSVQEYAASKFFSTLQMRWAHEVAVALGGYVLGEYGMNICENPGMGGYDQFAALHQHYASCSPKTQAVLLTTYAKIVNLYPDTRELIVDFLEKMSSSSHVELQQRACEYLKLPTMPAMMEAVLKEMPLYPEDRENKLVKADIRNSVAGQAPTPAPPTMVSKPVSLPTANTSKPIDLISLDDHDVQPPPASASDDRKLMNLSSEQALRIKSCYNALLATPAGQIGLLLDDECLIVNLVCEYKAHLGRLSFQLVNRAPTQLNDVKFAVNSGPGESESLRVVSTQLAPSFIAAGDRVRAQVTLECMRPFRDPVMFSLSYSCGGRPEVVYMTPLPIKATSFFEPVILNKGVFMDRWKSIEGPDSELQETFTSSRTVTPELIASIRGNIFAAMHLGLATDIDTANTATACATFRTGTMGPDGATPLVIGAMIRLEADPNGGRFRVTIRCKNTTVATSLKEAVKSVLSV